MNSATEEKFLERLQERLNMVKKTTFFNPKTLNRVREDSVYAMNIDEFRHHTKPYLINSMETAESIVSMLEEVPPNVRQNLVAIVSYRCRMNISAMSIVNHLRPFKPPQLVHNVTHLLSKFRKENDMFCSNKVELIVETKFRKETCAAVVNPFFGIHTEGTLKKMERIGKLIAFQMPRMLTKDCADGGGIFTFVVYDAASK